MLEKNTYSPSSFIVVQIHKYSALFPCASFKFSLFFSHIHEILSESETIIYTCNELYPNQV